MFVSKTKSLVRVSVQAQLVATGTVDCSELEAAVSVPSRHGLHPKAGSNLFRQVSAQTTSAADSSMHNSSSAGSGALMLWPAISAGSLTTFAGQHSVNALTAVGSVGAGQGSNSPSPGPPNEQLSPRPQASQTSLAANSQYAGPVALCRCASVKFFSKLNNLFFGYFDPINIFFDDKK